MPVEKKRWKLVCRDGHPFSVVLTNPDGDIVPFVRELIISIDCEHMSTEIMYTQAAGVCLLRLGIDVEIAEPVELDLEFQKDTVIKARRVHKDTL